MSPFPSRSRIFTVMPTGEGGPAGVRANGDNGVDGGLAAGGSWQVDFLAYEEVTPPTHNEWDEDERVEFDGTDEMVVSEDGIYLVVAESNAGYFDNNTSGYYQLDLTKNGLTVASYSQSWSNFMSFGYIDMPTVRWVGTAIAGDRFALIARNETNDFAQIGWYLNFMYAVYVAPWSPGG